MIEAVEQSGRFHLPRLHSPQPLTAYQSFFQKSLWAVANPGAPLSFHTFAQTSPEDCGIIIGPEGGWSEDEEAWFQAQEIPPVNLGPLILRSETAAITAMAQLTK